VAIRALNQYNIQKIIAPNLTTVSNDIEITACEYIISASFPSLISISGSITMGNDSPRLGYVNFPNLTIVGAIPPLLTESSINSFNISLLGVIYLDISSLTIVSGSFSIGEADNLTSLNLSSLTDVLNDFNINLNGSITNINLSSLTTAGSLSTESTTFYINNNPSLTTITLNDNLVITGSDNAAIRFNNNALDQTTVDRVLEVFASGSQSNLILFLNGGTNSLPSSAGYDSRTILEGRGWTVNLNV